MPTNTAAGRGSDKSRSFEQLPSSVVQTILLNLDICSICSIASTCRTFRASSRNIFTYLSNFHFSGTAPTELILAPLLPANSHLRSMKVDCCRLNDSAIDLLARPSLQELCLFNCGEFSGRLLNEIGIRCQNIRYLHLGSVADKTGHVINISDLESLLQGCSELENLTLGFDVSTFPRHSFARACRLASPNLVSLEIRYISLLALRDILSPTLSPEKPCDDLRAPVFYSLQKLSVSVDYISDTLMSTISDNLPYLTHLDLRDAPVIEPRLSYDLTNCGIDKINQNGKLKHLSLVRSQEFFVSYFRRVNDLSFLMMADRCSAMESICLGGFSCITDTGFRAVLHSSSNLIKVKISHGANLTDLVFHDITSTNLSLNYVSLRWCSLLSDLTASCLTTNSDLAFLDLRDCRNLGDEAVMAISSLPKLKILLLDSCDVSDAGISYLKRLISSSLTSLSVRGCKRLTDGTITALFGEGGSDVVLEELDLSSLPNLTDNGVLLLLESRASVAELRLRQCPLIGDAAVMALATIGIERSRLRLLDLYNCGRITCHAFEWLKKPYLPRLKWLGVTRWVNTDLVDALAKNRPHLHVACRGEELGSTEWDHCSCY